MSEQNEAPKVKVAHQSIIDYLFAHQDESVSAVLNDVVALAKPQRSNGSDSFIKNEAGEVIGMHDFYSKRWMNLIPSRKGDVEAVEFGVKTGSSSGLNPTCKIGSSLWSKQDNKYKKALMDLPKKLLEDLETGTLALEDLKEALETEQERLKAEKDQIAQTYMVGEVTHNISDLGFDSKAELEAFLLDQGEIFVGSSVDTTTN